MVASRNRTSHALLPLMRPNKKERRLYSIDQAREILGGISRNTLYKMLKTGALGSVVFGTRRFISDEAIDQFVIASSTTESPAISPLKSGTHRR
jgi:excisionase family DNA binding protein